MTVIATQTQVTATAELQVAPEIRAVHQASFAAVALVLLAMPLHGVVVIGQLVHLTARQEPAQPHTLVAEPLASQQKHRPAQQPAQILIQEMTRALQAFARMAAARILILAPLVAKKNITVLVILVHLQHLPVHLEPAALAGLVSHHVLGAVVVGQLALAAHNLGRAQTQIAVLHHLPQQHNPVRHLWPAGTT